MTNIRRYEPIGRPVFITAVCYHRQPFLEADWQKELLLSVMRKVKSSTNFSMIAYVIRNDEDLHRHMDYIHYNPVKHGTISRPGDYRWSSFNTHLQMRNYDSLWGVSSMPEAIRTMKLE